MKYYIKQKVFSFKDTFTVKDEEQNNVYQVKGKMFSLSNKIEFMNMDDVVLLQAHKKIFSFLPKYFIYDQFEQPLAEVQKKLSFKPMFVVEAMNEQLEVEGSLFGHTFSVMKHGDIIASIQKKVMSFGDSYEIDILDDTNKELYLFLVIVIDQVIHESNGKGGRNYG